MYVVCCSLIRAAQIRGPVARGGAALNGDVKVEQAIV
jgi:hypothetical protein